MRLCKRKAKLVLDSGVQWGWASCSIRQVYVCTTLSQYVICQCFNLLPHDYSVICDSSTPSDESTKKRRGADGQTADVFFLKTFQFFRGKLLGLSRVHTTLCILYTVCILSSMSTLASIIIYYIMHTSQSTNIMHNTTSQYAYDIIQYAYLEQSTLCIYAYTPRTRVVLQ